MDTTLSLVIGGIALPVFAEAVLWLLHKLHMSEDWDKPATLILALLFAFIVVFVKFYPEYDQVLVYSVTTLYTLIMTLQKILSDTKLAVSRRLARQ